MLDIVKAMIIAGAIASVGVIKFYYPAYKDDNVIEQAVEKAIEYETGANIDITPLYPNK